MPDGPFNPGGFGTSNRPMGCSFEDLERIEHDLLQELNLAKAEYKLAIAQHHGRMATGGSRAASEALQTHLTVVRRYRTAIKTFSDFVLHGKLPDSQNSAGSLPPISPSG